MPDSDNDYGQHPVAQRAREVMTRGMTRSTLYVAPHPPYAVSGHGCRLVDQRGHNVIDLNNNYTAMIHGHAYAPIIDAVTRQLPMGTAFGLPTESEVVLAETLAQRTGLPKWRFSNSGTEAVMTAMRAARAFTGRDVIVRFAGSYHGVHETVVDETAPGVPATTPHISAALPQGDRVAFDDLFRSRGGDIAAVLIDLMPNRTGLVPVDPEFVAHVATTAAAHGAVLIVDEVITFRLALGGLHTSYGLRPDLVTVGKIVGGGFPVGAVGGRDDIMAVFDPAQVGTVSIGGTFSANPVTMVAGQAALAHFGQDQIDRLNAQGDQFRHILGQAGVAVNGLGSLARLAVAADPRQLWWRMYELGVLSGTSGLMALSTPMTDQDVAIAADAVARAVGQATSA